MHGVGLRGLEEPAGVARRPQLGHAAAAAARPARRPAGGHATRSTATPRSAAGRSTASRCRWRRMGAVITLHRRLRADDHRRRQPADRHHLRAAGRVGPGEVVPAAGRACWRRARRRSSSRSPPATTPSGCCAPPARAWSAPPRRRHGAARRGAAAARDRGARRHLVGGVLHRRRHAGARSRTCSSAASASTRAAPALLTVLERMGARIGLFNRRTTAAGEPIADIEVRTPS